jgi:hypothetical protein
MANLVSSPCINHQHDMWLPYLLLLSLPFSTRATCSSSRASTAICTVPSIITTHRPPSASPAHSPSGSSFFRAGVHSPLLQCCRLDSEEAAKVNYDKTFNDVLRAAPRQQRARAWSGGGGGSKARVRATTHVRATNLKTPSPSPEPVIEI